MNDFERQQLFNYRIKQLLTGLGIIHNAWNTRDERRPTSPNSFKVPQGIGFPPPLQVIPRVTEANIGGLLGHYLDPDKIGPQ